MSRNSLTLKARLVRLTAALLGVISLFMFLFFPAQLRREAVRDLLARAQIIARMTAFGISPAVVFRDVAVLDEGLAAARQNADLAFLVVTDSAGAVIGEDRRAPAVRTAVAAAAAGDIVGDSMAIVSVPIESNGRTVGRLYVAMSLRTVVADVRRAREAVALVSLLVFGVAMLAVLAIGTYVTRPLAAMVTAVDAIAGGDRSQRASASGSAEVDHLATAFNRMLDTVDSVQRQLVEANRTLETRVTERTAELEQARDQLLQAQKMEAIGRLAGGVAHDFNNLLTVIVGDTEFTLATLAESDPRRADLQEVLEAAQSAKLLAQQLLAFGRKQILQTRVVDLNRLVGDANLMLRRLIGGDIEVRVVAGPRLAPVRADITQLQQVIMNLALNAQDAMPGGGTLTLETGMVTVDEAFARAHRLMPPGEWVMLTVRDTGVGMSEEVREHLFEPFFTTKAPGHGTGLGLATVYGIVKQSDGYVFVDSVPGVGTEFRIYLPPVEAEREQVPAPIEAPLAVGKETVLLVEDEPMVRKIGCRALAARGYEILTAASGDEALQVVERHQGPIHCLVTDVVMPGMNGFELAEKLSARIPGLKVLVTSGYAADAARLSDNRFAGSAYLPKPFTGAELARMVRSALVGAPAD